MTQLSPEIAHFQIARMIAALRLEIKMGMTLKAGKSVAVPIREQYHITARKKEDVLATLEEKYEATYGRKYGSK